MSSPTDSLDRLTWVVMSEWVFWRCLRVLRDISAMND